MTILVTPVGLFEEERAVITALVPFNEAPELVFEVSLEKDGSPAMVFEEDEVSFP